MGYDESTIFLAKFRIGRIVSTPHALECLTPEDILMGIQRHQAGEWGDEAAEDRKANDLALLEGTRIFSAYRTTNGRKFWIITEADRSRTTILMPEDY